MTHRTLHGLAFKAWSPSHYELCTTGAASYIELVTITFDGTGWHIHVLMKPGQRPSVWRRGPFTSFAQAVQLIAFGLAKEESA